MGPFCHGQERGRGRLELRGEIVVPRDTVRPDRRIAVGLYGISLPYQARTSADHRGRFRFKNLLPGSYNLSINIPGAGELVKSIEVTPSFADARRRVEKKFFFDEPTLREQARPSPQGLVSVRELTIPRKARSEMRRAQGRLRRHDVEGAIRHLENAVAAAPQYVEALNNLGTIYFQKRDLAKAESYFRRAGEAEPDAFEPRANLGGVLLAEGRPEEALEINLEAQDARPSDALANAQLGINYLMLGNYDDAVNYLRRTAELDPAHFSNPQLSLAEIYLRRSEEEAALRELEDFLKYHPDAAAATNVRATIEKLQQAGEERAE
jgi:tetratricopeptide (TPR) repeat protein